MLDLKAEAFRVQIVRIKLHSSVKIEYDANDEIDARSECGSYSDAKWIR